MNLFHAVILGLIQGITEFIPVSSTAHLLIGQYFLGLPADNAVFSFLVIVQLGTVVSLLVCFWRDLWSILAGIPVDIHALLQHEHKKQNGNPEIASRLGLYVLLATIPALLAGFLLAEAVKDLFSAPLLQAAIRLFSAAILMTLAESMGRRSRTLETMNWLDAIVIGLFQIISIFPGASRSGTTISAGLLRGFERKAAAKFAFLMSVPVMLAAGIYEAIEVVHMNDPSGFILPLAVGFVSAAISGWLAVKWLLRYLARNSLFPFAIYCTLAGIVSLIIALT